ncbi:hypothetical protein [Candidatus Liberibacter sp.]|uniref:hypothetical protein n=1 Tax=Candidatus Liberibacter sp. TaxID=34022 RepID=UPI0015F60078|nr:hypothetical protein [Candidatus Liberibacter sp.]MBA5724118.1 hypothetical protein [Candidatus Liberibacter sp.]
MKSSSWLQTSEKGLAQKKAHIRLSDSFISAYTCRKNQSINIGRQGDFLVVVIG